MIERRSSTCSILLCAGLSIAGCGGGLQTASGEHLAAFDESRTLGELREEAEKQLPHDAPAYMNLLVSDSVRRIAADPNRFPGAWRRDLLGELNGNPGALSRYAEALLVLPRAFSDGDISRQAAEEYDETLHQVWADRRAGPRANKVAMLTLIKRGDQEAIKASVALYKAADTEERREEYLRAYRYVSDIALEYYGDPLWSLANEVLSACSQIPPTAEQLDWCRWLGWHPHRSCFGPVARIFLMYEALSPTKEKEEEGDGAYIGWVGIVPGALASINGSQALPLLRRNFGNPWKRFAECCLECALSLGDPEALKYLINTLPPEAVHAATQPDSSRDVAERLVGVVKLLEPGTLPELDEALVLSGVEPIPADFEKAWVRLYQAAREDRVQLIAKPGSGDLVFQVVYRDEGRGPVGELKR